MTAEDVPTNPSVLNTTVLSNFASIDQVQLLAGLSGICAVPVVREELHDGVENHSHLQAALDFLNDEIPVVVISDAVANREAVVSDHLDPGEAQAFALADTHDGRLRPVSNDFRISVSNHSQRETARTSGFPSHYRSGVCACGE